MPYLCGTGSIGKGKKMFKERAVQTTQKEKEKALGNRANQKKDNRANQKGKFEKSKRVT